MDKVNLPEKSRLIQFLSCLTSITLANTRSTQHRRRWYEFTRSSVISGYRTMKIETFE